MQRLLSTVSPTTNYFYTEKKNLFLACKTFAGIVLKKGWGYESSKLAVPLTGCCTELVLMIKAAVSHPEGVRAEELSQSFTSTALGKVGPLHLN